MENKVRIVGPTEFEKKIIWRKRGKIIFKELMAENFSGLMSDTKLYNQEAQ